MDIDQALSEARDALSRYRNNNEDEQTMNDAADDLADAFEALDGWLGKGGFLPEGWSR